MLLCGLMLIFCVSAISAELVAYPHVGCFTGSSIRRYFNRELRRSSSVQQNGENPVMRCFEAARNGGYDIFAVTKGRTSGKPYQCLTGRDAKKNLKRYQEGSGCQKGLGGQNSFDIYLVPGSETDSCQDLPDGEYQDSLFCNRFYTCMDGKATVKLCPMGLLFDPATRQCLHEVPCPRGEPCNYEDDGEYPHPTSCRKYLVCHNHQAFEAECPSYLWFNDDTKECDSPANTDCSNDPCEESVCLNGGTCTAAQEEDSKFKCTCMAGFTGTRCEVKVKPCSLHPCKNGGTCQENGDSTYECKCKLGYGGQNCTEKSDFENSEILSHNEGLLNTLLEYMKDVETNGKQWKMCFNARDHSYSASSFHAYCNNKGPTVTLVEVGRYVFGGYTDQAWTSAGSYKSSTRSFLFSLRGPSNTAFKSPLFQSYNYATYDNSGYGPTFGSGHDLYLSNSCRTSKSSYSRLGNAYKLPSGYSGSTALAGSSYFLCDDYEVFYLA